MQIEYNKQNDFLKGCSDKKPTKKIIEKRAKEKGFDISNISIHNNDGFYTFFADIIPSKQITKELENEILSKLDILFQRKNYTKEEQTELKRLVWK